MKKATSVMAFALLLLMGGIATRTGPLPAASNPPSELHGVREFFASGDFAVPEGVTSVMVEMWGGGGAGFDGTASAAAGAGGGGAYTRSVITVVPGETYQVVVGAGGVISGGNGGASEVLGPPSNVLHSNVLLFAGGGQGGSATAGGAGGEADPEAEISHPGSPGMYLPANPFDNGGNASASNLAPNYVAAATGGVGFGGVSCATTFCSAAAYPGSPGYVLITW